ncbi:MAG: bifunctional lysylphosphatidylglycerol flippase/synthetase MprF, partial [Parvularcula sp.]
MVDGLVVAFGLALLIAPDLVASSLAAPADLVRGAGLLIALLVGLVVGLVQRRGAQRQKDRLGLVALMATTLMWASAAMAIVVLLPQNLAGAPLSALPLLLAAALLALVSGIPAGIGVFDAAALFSLQALGAAPVLAALFVFRLIYFVSPLMIAGFLAGRRASAKGPSRPALRTLVPPLFAILAAMAGTMLLVTAALPAVPDRIAALNRALPLGLIEASHFLSSIIGVLMFPIALGLRARRTNARLFMLGLLGIGVVTSLLRGGDFEEAGVLALLLFGLWSVGDAFDRPSGTGLFSANAVWMLIAVGTIGGAIWIGLLAYGHVEYRDELWWTFLRDGDASRFLRAMVAASLAFIGLFVIQFVRGQPIEDLLPDAADLDHATKVIAAADAPQADAHLALLGDKRFLWSASGQSFIMYGVRGRYLIAMGPPVGKADECRDLVRAFRETADKVGAIPCFYSVRKTILPTLIDAGFVLQKIGETALIPLADFSLQGSKRAKLRQAQRRLSRQGLTFSVLPPERVSLVVDQLETVSDEWLHHHHGTEKSFTLGRFSPDYLQRFPCAVIKKDDQIVAFANLWTTPQKTEASIDLMRYGAAAPHGVMESLFVELLVWAKAEGFQSFDLGMAPLAGLETGPYAPLFSRLGAMIYRRGEKVYGFSGLRTFKNKFSPAWEPLYLATPSAASIPIALGNVALLTSNGLLGMFGRA